MSRNSEIVSAFTKAWAEGDVEKIMSFFTDDAVYLNVPIPPEHRGKAAIRRAIEGFFGMARAIEFRVHYQGESADGVVFNERTDCLDTGAKRVELPVAGIFELRDGKISAWRDYFDMQMFTS